LASQTFPFTVIFHLYPFPNPTCIYPSLHLFPLQDIWVLYHILIIKHQLIYLNTSFPFYLRYPDPLLQFLPSKYSQWSCLIYLIETMTFLVISMKGNLTEDRIEIFNCKWFLNTTPSFHMFLQHFTNFSNPPHFT
jgi:hypothetical protein